MSGYSSLHDLHIGTILAREAWPHEDRSGQNAAANMVPNRDAIHVSCLSSAFRSAGRDVRSC